uniref:BTB/POZ domaincontaining protein 7like [Nasonia vitripennis] n=1 Tax=Lepeophtheirus salmonis TaxID=72036 RepID=A0A0K2U366_LEPSM
MGLSSSTPSSWGTTSYGAQYSSGGGDVIRACRCYSRDSSRCTRHSLTFSQDPLPQCKKARRAHGFATFKKKLIGKCKNIRGPDHSKLFREYGLDASVDVLRSLLDQYEISNVLKDLSVQADLARPPAHTLRQSLGDLLNDVTTSCADVILTSYEARVPAHKAVILARCPSFFHQRILPVQEQLSRSSDILECPLPFTISGLRLTPDTLRNLMEYLYTGELPRITSDLSAGSSLVPNSLESDIAFLYDSMSLSDCVLVFGSGLEGGFSQTLHCHRVILSARSSFFQKLIHRRLVRNAREQGTLSSSSPQKIKNSRESLSLLLDENVIPARYGKVLLHAMYLDTLDLNLVSAIPDDHLDIITPCDEIDSVSSAKLLPEDRRVRYAMDLYEIGRFLEFDLLSQNCEDFLAQSLRPENVIPILDWSLKPHGSAWIRRQAFQYVQEEFTLIANSEYFEKLDINILKDLLESDYTQASELEILQAIIRWGELQLLNKSEFKDGPNPCHTLSRRNNQNHYHIYGGGSGSNNSSSNSSSNSRRREVCDNELRTLIGPLLNCLRIQHILPRDDRHSDVLDNALHRNLIPRPPCFFAQTDDVTKYSAWDPRNFDGLYVKPRLFLPYYEECKNILKDRFGHDISSDLAFPGFDIPDTLYMVKNQNDPMDILEQQPNSLPDKERISKMLKRTRKLLQTVAVQRAMASPLVHKWDVVHLVELRVVRECNLPDSYTTVLRNSELEESNYSEAEMVPSSTGHLLYDNKVSRFTSSA